MRIAISGATGFVGTSLVPILQSRGAEILLVGRDTAKIESLFPGVAACGYDALEQQAAAYDLLVHLAALNNNSDAADEQFRAINVDLSLETAAVSRRAGVARFVYVSSIHALDAKNLGPYAQSKREAAVRLRQIYGDYALTLHLPAVHGERWAGALAHLNRLPRSLARTLFGLLSALKPTLHVSRLADFLLQRARATSEVDVILSDGQQGNVAYRAARRLMDLGFALVVAMLFWWAFVLLWIAIRLESPGPGIFAQDRVGREGKIFTCYKFRTMKQGTAQAATNLVSADAVTGLGRLLRRSKVDELPQIWNIFRNEISLVGPRPCLPTQNELIEARGARAVLSLKPGITGLAQVNGIDMSEPATLASWDARYAALQSLVLDLKIILATVLGRGGGDRVNRAR